MPRRVRVSVASAGIAAFLCSAVLAGEILILQPASPSSGNRNERAAQQISDRAREQSGQAIPDAAYVLDPVGAEASQGVPGQADLLRQNAREYLDPAPTGTAGEGTQVILRAAPLTDAERMRLKARAYTPEPIKPAGRNCGTVSNQVGTIGEGSDAHKSENVIEKGGGAVNPNCR